MTQWCSATRDGGECLLPFGHPWRPHRNAAAQEWWDDQATAVTVDAITTAETVSTIATVDSPAPADDDTIATAIAARCPASLDTSRCLFDTGHFPATPHHNAKGHTWSQTTA